MRNRYGVVCVKTRNGRILGEEGSHLVTNANDIATSLRRTLRTGPAPVWIVTTATPAGRFGMTATAVLSASLAPPTLAICVNRTASLYGALLTSERFGVQAVTSDHMDIAHQFGSTRLAAERFSHGNVERARRPMPHRRLGFVHLRTAD